MPSRETIGLAPGELKALFNALSIWDKLERGVFTTIVKANDPAKAVDGGWSRMLAHYNAAGAHICTTHRIIGPGGDVLHEDEADLYVGDVTIYKLGRASQGPGAPF